MQLIKRFLYFLFGILLSIPLTFFGVLNFVTAGLIFNNITSFFYNNCFSFFLKAWNPNPNNQAGLDYQNHTSEPLTATARPTRHLIGDDAASNKQNIDCQANRAQSNTKSTGPTRLSLFTPQSSKKITFEDKIFMLKSTSTMLRSLKLKINGTQESNACVIRIQGYENISEACTSMRKLCAILSDGTIKTTDIDIEQFPNNSRDLENKKLVMSTSGGEIRLPICSKTEVLTKEEIESTLARASHKSLSVVRI